MKWSKFIFKVVYNKQILLYNTLNYAVVILEEEIYNRIEDMISIKNLQKTNEVMELIDQEFLIPDEIDEKSVFMEMLKNEYMNDKRMCIQILTTTWCNFKCPYCYQEGICRYKNITIELIETLEVFLRNYLDKNRIIEKIHIILHGGEPTTYWKYVNLIFDKIKKICDDYNLIYDTQIITNGYLLNDEKIKLLVENNLRNVQVTIDGIGKINDTRRISKAGKATFETIVSNIHKILKTDMKGKVNIRINYDRANIETIPETIRFLKNEFIDKRVKITLGYITKTLDNLESNDYINKYGLTLDELIEYYPVLHKVLRENGCQPENMLAFDGLCVSKMRHNMVISPTGDIYKCPSGVGVDEFIEGNIHDMNTQIPDYMFFELYDYCFKNNCPFIPVCHTSCRFIARAKYGTIKAIDCKRRTLEKINKQLMIDQYMKE